MQTMIDSIKQLGCACIILGMLTALSCLPGCFLEMDPQAKREIEVGGRASATINCKSEYEGHLFLTVEPFREGHAVVVTLIRRADGESEHFACYVTDEAVFPVNRAARRCFSGPVDGAVGVTTRDIAEAVIQWLPDDVTPDEIVAQDE